MPAEPPDPTDCAPPRHRLSALQRPSRTFIGVTAAIAMLHLLGWGTLLVVIAVSPASIRTTAFGVGMAMTAYMLGVRHAFDADHIAAIDNTTRRLIRQNERPISVGFWFSCGHSTVVFVLALLLVLGVHTIAAPVLDGDSNLHAVAGLIGTVISSSFLYAIAAVNIVVLADIWRALGRLRSGHYDGAALEAQLERRGLMNRLIGRVAGVVTRPRQMYAVGLLFGLGFDTATEIALLVLTASGAASGLPWYGVLCLPVLFAAGMSLADTSQASLMSAAYGWALVQPVRRVYYNLVITGLSVAVALGIGTIETMGLIGQRLKLQGVVWTWAAAVNLNMLGFVIAGLFVATWACAVAVWKYGRMEARWVAAPERPEAMRD